MNYQFMNYQLKLSISKTTYKLELPEEEYYYVDHDLYVIIEVNAEEHLYEANLCSHSFPDVLHVCSTIQDEDYDCDFEEFIDEALIKIMNDHMVEKYYKTCALARENVNQQTS